MSEGDDAAAKRAALAEARRQKILARGADRLNRITLGTPLPEAAPPGSTAEPAAEAAEAAGAGSGPAAAAAPAAAPPAPPPRAPPAAPAPAAEAPATSPELPAAAPEDVAASMRQAEQAMHALLNQLSDPRPGQALGNDGGGMASLLQAMAAQAAAASAAAGPAGSTAAASPRGLQGPLGAEPAARASSSPASGGRPGPGPASAGTVGRSNGAGAGAALEAVLGGVGAVLLVVAGPRLSGAVARTRLARCLLALLAAAALHAGLVEPAALRVPPVVLLLLTEVALVAGAWVMVRSGAGSGAGLSRSGSMSRVGSLSSMSLDRMAGDADADSGGAAGAGGAAAASSAGAGPSPPPKFDWLTLVPGLRPLLDGLSSLQALVGGLVADGTVFVAATVALAACSDLMRPPAVGAGAAGGRVEL